MNFKEFLVEEELFEDARAQAKSTIIAHAKDGDRIIADGKTIWAGLGNRSGLHSYQWEVLSDKWEKSGANFTKKLDKLTADKIEIQSFRNQTRDRGRWVTIKTFTHFLYNLHSDPKSLEGHGTRFPTDMKGWEF